AVWRHGGAGSPPPLGISGDGLEKRRLRGLRHQRREVTGIDRFLHAQQLAAVLQLAQEITEPRGHAPESITCAHSTSSSARRSSDGGIVNPRLFAVLTLTMSRTFVGCSTGRSLGLAPLRILST